MKIIDFRFLTTNDITDKKYNNWSRAYEYPLVYNFINDNLFIGDKIHNTSWGFGGIHIVFRDNLDILSKNVVHSDLVNSELKKTLVYDITNELPDFNESFDFVLNISTIEHIPVKEKRIGAIKNLLKQVKSGGYLIVTFDYPRVNLNEVEELIGAKCNKSGKILNGNNSIFPNTTYGDLNIILLIIQK